MYCFCKQYLSTASDDFSKLADTSYDTDSTRKSEGMTLKELSENEYLKIKRMIDGAHIQPLAREVKAHKPRTGDVARGPQLTNK